MNGEWEAIQIRSETLEHLVKSGGFKFKWTVYYVSTYAVNSEGISYGSSEKFTTASEDQPPFPYRCSKIGWFRRVVDQSL